MVLQTAFKPHSHQNLQLPTYSYQLPRSLQPFLELNFLHITEVTPTVNTLPDTTKCHNYHQLCTLRSPQNPLQSTPNKQTHKHTNRTNERTNERTRINSTLQFPQTNSCSHQGPGRGHRPPTCPAIQRTQGKERLSSIPTQPYYGKLHAPQHTVGSLYKLLL